MSLVVNVLLPYEVYMALSYKILLPRLVWWTVALSCSIALVFFFLAIIPEKHSKVSFSRRLRHALLGSRTLIALSLMILMGAIWVKLASGNGITSAALSQSVETTCSDNSEWTIANKIDTVCLLQEEQWSQLTIQEKLEVLEVILKIEENYLGLTWNLRLKRADLDPHTLAEYDHFEKKISIDLEHLQTDPASKVLNSLCHECYHAYQHQIVSLFNDTAAEYRNMLVFEKVDTYLKEFSNYENGESSIEEYYTQIVEIEARKYARTAVDEYFERIAELTDSI